MNNMGIMLLVILSVFFLSITSLSCTKLQTYVNDVADYKISGPPNWHMRPTKNYSVTFSKYKNETFGNSSIVVTVELLNPDVLAPLSYINNVFLPQLREQLKNTRSMQITMITKPRVVQRNGYEWAMAKYYIGTNIIQNIYVNFSKKNLFAISLTSFKEEFPRQEKLFFATLDSFQYLK